MQKVNLRDGSFGSWYYIHYHKENIGKLAGNGKAYSANTINRFLENQREGAKQAALKSYKSGLKLHLLSSGNSLKLVNDIVDREDMLEIFNKELREQSQKSLNKNFNAEKFIQAGNNLKEAVLKVEDDLEDEAKKWKNYLKALEKVMDFLNAPKAKEMLSDCLKIEGVTNKNFYNTLGESLQPIVKELRDTANGTHIKADAAELENFARSLELISINALSPTYGGSKADYAKNIVELHLIPDLSEIEMAVAKNTVSGALANELRGLKVKNNKAGFSHTGKDTIESDFIDPTGEIIFEIGKELGLDPTRTNKNGDVYFRNTPRAGKVDWKQKNAAISLSALTNGDVGEIKIDLSGSNKTYLSFGSFMDKKTNTFKGKATVSSGSAGNLYDLTITTFKGATSRYLAFNVLATNGADGWRAPYETYKYIMIQKNINKLFISRNLSKEFNDLFIVNGAVVTTFDLLTSAMVDDYKTFSSIYSCNLPKIDNSYAEKGVIFRQFRVNRQFLNESFEVKLHFDKLMASIANLS